MQRNGGVYKIFWVLPKLTRYSKRVFVPQGTVNYELIVCHCYHNTERESIREQYGSCKKCFLDESACLADSSLCAMVPSARFTLTNN